MSDARFGLVRFLFKGELPILPPDHPPVEETEKLDGSERHRLRRMANNGETVLKFQVVRFLSWSLGLTLILCIIGSFILAGFGKEIPSFVSEVIAGIIGYFGGAISAFFGIGGARQK